MKEDQLLFEVSKLIAESDSIGEGYGYCSNYNEKKHSDPNYQEYRDLAQVIIDLVRVEMLKQMESSFSKSPGESIR